MKDIETIPNLIQVQHIDAFVNIMAQSGYDGYFNFGAVGIGLKLSEAFQIMNRDLKLGAIESSIFPLKFAYLCPAPTCDHPQNIIRFTINYNRNSGINIIEMDMRRRSCYEGYDIAHLTRMINNNKIPSRGQVHQILMKSIPKHAKRLKWGPRL